MKKHLLGFAIFSFIFASFAVAFAFLYAPKIPQIAQVEEVRQPVFETDKRNRCNKKSENNMFEVISTQYNLDEKKLISKIKMTSSSFDRERENIIVNTKLYTMGQSEAVKFPVKDVKVWTFEPTKNSKNEWTFYVESDLSKYEIDPQENLYARFNFSIAIGCMRGSFEGLEDSQPKSVLFVHGKNSISKK